MARPAAYESQEIGPRLIAARAAGIPWKVLQEHFGLGRTRLFQLWREARKGQPAALDPITIDVHEHRDA